MKNKADERCIHDVHGQDCLECYPSKDEQTRAAIDQIAKQIGMFPSDVEAIFKQAIAYREKQLAETAGQLNEGDVAIEALKTLPKDWSEVERFAHSCGVGYGVRASAAAFTSRIEELEIELDRTAKASIHYFNSANDISDKLDEALAKCERLERELERANKYHENLADERDEALAKFTKLGEVNRQLLDQGDELEKEHDSLKQRLSALRAALTMVNYDSDMMPVRHDLQDVAIDALAADDAASQNK